MPCAVKRLFLISAAVFGIGFETVAVVTGVVAFAAVACMGIAFAEIVLAGAAFAVTAFTFLAFAVTASAALIASSCCFPLWKSTPANG